MRWYQKLYMGDEARKKKTKIMSYTVLRKFQPDVYLIMLPGNPDNILEMLPASEFRQPYYKKKEIWEKLFVIGIAKGYDEGILLMGQIIAEVYHSTGGFDVAAYIAAER